MERGLQTALDFIDAANAASSLDQLEQALVSTFATLGVPHYTLGAMLSPDGGARRFTPLTRGVTDAWSQHYWEQQYFNVDAAVHVALQRPTSFSWAEVEAQRLSKASARLFNEIRDAMPVNGGFVIPIHDSHGFAGLGALFLEDHEPTPTAIPALKLVSLYGVERAKVLLNAQRSPSPALCPLSARQREILAYAAMGKSEADTGDIIGISGATVRDHLTKIRATMDVRTKTQAVALAVHRGWIVL